MKGHRIGLIAGGIQGSNRCLQPWRYLLEVARGLAHSSYKVTILTDRDCGVTGLEAVDGVSIHRLASISSPRWGANRELVRVIDDLDLQLVVWHMGLTSLLHQSIPPVKGRVSVGIFTSPIYRSSELTRLGPVRLARSLRLSSVHLIGSLLPDWLLRRKDLTSSLSVMVVQTQTTGRQLLKKGLWNGRLEVIPPGIDDVWISGECDREIVRRSLGFSHTDMVVVYFGSPEPLRGLPTLLRAFALAHSRDSRLKLLILSRQQDRCPARLEESLRELGIEQVTRSVYGFLQPQQLMEHVAASDLVALPFELVPSDAPLSLLEAQALDKHLITTRVACLPELATNGKHCLVKPGDHRSLAGAIQRAILSLNDFPGNKSIKINQGFPRSWKDVEADWVTLIRQL